MMHHVLDGPADAPVVILAHSLGTDHRLWDAQAAALRSRFRVLRYDVRGHGATPPPPGPWTIADLGRDVLALADRLGIERFHFCGLSIGGLVGLWLALHAGARLGKLVLCNTAARIGTVESWNARIAAVEAGGTAAIADGALERWLTAPFIARAPEVAARARAWLLATPPEGYAGCCAAIRDFDVRGEVGRIGAPTLVIAGAADVATTPGEARFLAERIPGAHLVVLPAAHLSNLEAEPDFTAALLDFLADDDRYKKGLATRRAVLGDAHVDRALASRTPFTAEFQELITRYAWGEIWTRPGLPKATRSLLTVGMLVALHREEELRLHVRGALRNGATVDEIKEVLLQAAIYCGVPAANSAFRVVADVLASVEGQP